MNEPRKNSTAFFALGLLGLLAGVVFWLVDGRDAATVPFACAAVVFAGAWFFERVSHRDED
ncbi:hypothetical protein [Streptomyces sp. NPDC097619]|uniref:hypothetical protein n=1 Tax=Streptomyces sp. NPDC097619 TaxID=3157228 RepID=UPI00331D44D3